MTIGIDDSDIYIQNKPHTILGAVLIRDPAKIDLTLTELKKRFKRSPQSEIKWNGMQLERSAREEISQELLGVLETTLPLVTVCEGSDRQRAAELLALQISDCFLAFPEIQHEHVEILFDEGILSNEPSFREKLKSGGCPCLLDPLISVVRSHASSAVQLADLFAGFNRRCTDDSLKLLSKQIRVQDTGPEHLIDTDLLTYINQALRWAMWGSVPPPPDPQNVTFDEKWPFKYVGGYGLRIHSSISPGLIKQIYDSRVVYMGCLH